MNPFDPDSGRQLYQRPNTNPSFDCPPGIRRKQRSTCRSAHLLLLLLLVVVVLLGVVGLAHTTSTTNAIRFVGLLVVVVVFCCCVLLLCFVVVFCCCVLLLCFVVVWGGLPFKQTAKFKCGRYNHKERKTKSCPVRTIVRNK
jgi:hypothetical protein